MKKFLSRTLFSFIFVILLTACGIQVKSNHSSNAMSSNFSDKTEVVDHSLEIREGMTSMQLKGKIRLDDGNMQWMLVDPHGEIVWDGEAHQKNIRINQKFEPTPGFWILRLTFENAQGSYDLDWTASN